MIWEGMPRTLVSEKMDSNSVSQEPNRSETLPAAKKKKLSFQTGACIPKPETIPVDWGSLGSQGREGENLPKLRRTWGTFPPGTPPAKAAKMLWQWTSLEGLSWTWPGLQRPAKEARAVLRGAGICHGAQLQLCAERGHCCGAEREELSAADAVSMGKSLHMGWESSW